MIRVFVEAVKNIKTATDNMLIHIMRHLLLIKRKENEFNWDIIDDILEFNETWIKECIRVLAGCKPPRNSTIY